jgi:hypothetical protein
VIDTAIWIEGGTRSGKTGVLVDRFCQWVNERSTVQGGGKRSLPDAKVPILAGKSLPDAKILILAGNDDSKRALGDLLAQQLVERTNYPIVPKTTIGFIQDEVLLFYPLLIQELNLTADLPLRLRPETEQELATKLWQPAIERLNWREVAPSEYRFVRRILDLIQLAAYAGTPLESVPRLLAGGFGLELDMTPIYSCMESLAAEWRDWCLARGLLTYGIMTELYWRHLLPHPTYRKHLSDRYQAILGDDLDDYPAIGRNICELLLDAGVWGAFTYNPDGMVRLGLSADPDYLLGLKSRCPSKVYLESHPTPLFGDRGTESPTVDLIVRAVLNPGNFLRLPRRVSAIETRTRGEMLKSAAETAIEQIHRGKVQPGEIAIIAPGLDAISRYTIVDTFEREGIPIESLNAQRPLVSNPSVRSILTLMALTYPNLGQLVSRDEIADLLVTLGSPVNGDVGAFSPQIDPVRAGLLADYCYAPAQSQPRLLPYVHFPRWDRLNASVATAYDRIVAWVERTQQQQPLPVVLITNAIEYFFDRGSQLPFDRLSALRELSETAQHYWQVVERTYSQTEYLESAHQITAQFILLLRQGTVSANPYPITQLKPQNQAVTLSNIFQYRASKRSHPWHFWLDVGSPLWAEGGAATLYGAHLLLKDRSRLARPWTEADTTESNERRLERILRDLCYRVTDRLYLCNSDLAIDGREQTGQLLTLIHSVERTVAIIDN